MGLQAVQPQESVSEREALAPAVAGLAVTLRALPADDPDYRLARELYELLAGKPVVEEAGAGSAVPALFGDAVKPALAGLRETHEMLDEDHWACLSLKTLHSYLRWQLRKDETLPRPPRNEWGD